MPETSDVLTFAEGNNQVIQRDPAAVGTLADTATLVVVIAASDTITANEVPGLSGSDLDKSGTDTATITEVQTRLGIDEPLDGGTLADVGELSGTTTPTGTDAFTFSEDSGVIGAGFGPTASDTFSFIDGYTTGPLIWDEGNWDEKVWAHLMYAVVNADTTDADTGALTDRISGVGDAIGSDAGLLSDASVLDKARVDLADVIALAESVSLSSTKVANDLLALSVEDTFIAGMGDILEVIEDITVTETSVIVVITSASDTATLADAGRQLGGDVIDKLATDSAVFTESVTLAGAVTASDTGTLVGTVIFGLSGYLKGKPDIYPYADGSVSIRLDPRIDGAVTFTP